MMADSDTDSSPDALRIRVRSDPHELAPVRHAIERFAEESGFDPPARDEIGLCVNEALANVMRHAYHGATDQRIDLCAERDAEGLRISIRDWGSGENPSRIAAAPSVDAAAPGGLGLICLRRLMDVVDFRPQPDGMLLVLIRRKRGSERPADIS